MLSANTFQSKKLNGDLYDCLVFTYIDIYLTPNVGITPNANFQSHIIQNNLSKNECMRQAYELKKDPRFYIKNNGEVVENFQNSDEVLGDHRYYCYPTRSN